MISQVFQLIKEFRARITLFFTWHYIFKLKKQHKHRNYIKSASQFNHKINIFEFQNGSHWFFQVSTTLVIVTINHVTIYLILENSDVETKKG